jgi:hypothetical protein
MLHHPRASTQLSTGRGGCQERPPWLKITTRLATIPTPGDRAAHVVTQWPPAGIAGDRGPRSETDLAGSAGGAIVVSACRTRRQIPPTTTSIRACGSPAHGSPTPFTDDIRLLPPRLERPWEATTLPFSQPRPQRRPRPRRRVVDLVKLQAAMADRQEQPFEAVELDVIVPQSGRLKLGPLPDPGWPPLRRRAGHDPLGLPDRLGSIGSGPRPSKVSLQLIPPVDVRGAPARSSVWLAASLGGVAFRAAQVLVGAVWVSTGALTLGGGLACRSGRGS